MVDVTQSLSRVWLACLLAAFATMAPPPAAAGEPEQYRWSGVKRVVVVGDVHGAAGSLEQILGEAGLIDGDRIWAGGDAHLVMLGDILDRGPDSRQALTLIMRLQSEAEAAGGHVHLVLGNHEVMNLVGELSYTSDAEFAAFAKEEDAKERKAAFKRTLKSSLAQNGDLGKMRKVFVKRYPQGYFGHRQAFSPQGLFGRWLLDQQILVIVNDVAFVHGGLSPILLDVEPDRINPVAMGELLQFLEAQQQLMELGVLAPEMPYKDQITRVAAFVEHGGQPAEAQEPARLMFQAAEGMVFRRDGPLWYRGSSLNPEAGEAALVKEVLDHLHVERVVVGHTPNHTGRITTRFEGAVVMADTGMLTAHYGGQPSAVEVKDGVCYEVYAGEGAVPLRAQRWELTPAMFSGPEDVLAFLESAPVVSIQPLGTGSTDPKEVILASNGRRMHAVFKDVDKEGHRHEGEVAAYRLDRMLGLGKVPPTVIREINGTRGSLQLWVANAVNEEDLESEDLRPLDPEAFEDQQRQADVFDVLILNIDRNGSNTLVTPGDWQIHLIDHEAAFAPRLPPAVFLEDGRSKLDDDLAARLAAIDAAEVRSQMAGLLTEEQIATLLKRRDLLIGTDS